MSATLFPSGDPYDEDRDLTTEEWEALLLREDLEIVAVFDGDDLEDLTK